MKIFQVKNGFTDCFALPEWGVFSGFLINVCYFSAIQCEVLYISYKLLLLTTGMEGLIILFGDFLTFETASLARLNTM